jgi:hypothetical protein
LNPLRHFTGVRLLRSNLLYALIWAVCLFCYLHAVEAELVTAYDIAAMEKLLAFSEPLSLRPDNVSKCSLWNSSSTCLVSPTPACCPPLRNIFGHGLLASIAASYEISLPSWIWPYLVWPFCLIWWLVDHLWSTTHNPPPLLESSRRRPHATTIPRSAVIESWLLRTLSRIVRTPFLPVEFPDFFICEQIVSLSSTLFEIQFVWCFFHISSDVVNSACDQAVGSNFFLLLMLPSLIRVLQSGRRYFDEPFHRSFYPHVLNGLKWSISMLCYVLYALTKTTEFLRAEASAKETIFILFLICSSIDSVFKTWYELFVEFGFFEKKSKLPFLRCHLLYPAYVYYVAIGATLIIRVAWIGKTFAEQNSPKGTGYWIYPLFAVLELVRRFIWNCVRVENDQVSNTERYKLVKLAPSVQVGACSVAMWDVSLEEFLRHLAGGEQKGARLLTNLILRHSMFFFRALSLTERTVLLTTVLETVAAGLQEVVATATSAVTPRAAATQSTSDGESSSTYLAMPPQKRNTMFFRDPRTGLLKTSIRLFEELHIEDKCRAVLLRVGPNRTFEQYLDDMVTQGHLDAESFNNFVHLCDHGGDEEGLEEPRSPKRSLSFLRRMGSISQ